MANGSLKGSAGFIVSNFKWDEEACDGAIGNNVILSE